MAFYDWNHDGKKNLTDDFIEYQIYRKYKNQYKTGDESSQNVGRESSGASGGCGWILFLIAFIACPPLGIILLFGMLFRH